MKQLLNRWVLLGILLFMSTLLLGLDEKGYNIRVRIDGYENDTCILAHHYGDKKYISATVTSKNKDNEFIFEGEKPLKGGVYLVLIKDKNNYFEFLVPNEEDQKDLVLSTKLDESRDLSKHLKVKGSKDNEAYLKYLKFNAKIQKKKAALEEKIVVQTEDQKKLKLQDSVSVLEAKLKAYQLKAIEKNPNFLSSKIIASWMMPATPVKIKGDKFAWILWTRAHFWDNFDFSDERLIRTPLFKQKIEIFTNQLTPTNPDSIIVAVDEILQRAKKGKNKMMFQYAASELLNKYAKSKIICMDAVYVFLGEKYYCSGGADWVDSVQLERICENVASIKPLQCGLYAPNIRLKKLDGTPISLYDVKAKYTAIYFWDPSCGNCSKTSDKLVPIYHKYKNKGFEIFGICSDSWKSLDKCKKKVAEKGMVFINTSEKAYPLAVAKKYYDLKANPYILLLDEDKKIMYKRIDPQQIDDILKREFAPSPEELEQEQED